MNRNIRALTVGIAAISFSVHSAFAMTNEPRSEEVELRKPTVFSVCPPGSNDPSVCHEVSFGEELQQALADHWDTTVRCESWRSEPSTCDVGVPLDYIYFLEDHSGMSCEKNWYHLETGVRVENGCRATFEIGVFNNTNDFEDIECISHGAGKTKCPTSKRIENAWFSSDLVGGTCIKDETWGFEQNHVWAADWCGGWFGVRLQN